MKPNGFSLLELMVVVTISGVLIAISWLYFGTMSRRAAVEGQVKSMYSDLMAARSQARYRQASRYVTVSATRFKVYTSSAACGSVLPTSAPLVDKTLKFPVATNPVATVCFDERGVANLPGQEIAAKAETICTQQNDPTLVTSLVITATSIQFGKQEAGGTCVDPTKIFPQ